MMVDDTIDVIVMVCCAGCDGYVYGDDNDSDTDSMSSDVLILVMIVMIVRRLRVVSTGGV